MALVPCPITALAESDADGTDNKNIVAGAIVIFYKNAIAQTLYDNAAGLNPSTSKVTDAQGQVTVFVEQGVYDLEVNGGTRRGVSVSADDSLLGTAALADLTQSSTDTTLGRVKKVDDFGIPTPLPVPNNDLHDVTISGLYKPDGSTLNTPIGSSNASSVLANFSDSNNGTLFYINRLTDNVYFARKGGGTWNGWTEIYHSGNTNFYEFGYGVLEAVTPICFAKGTAALRVYLPITSATLPSGADVNGTFTVQDVGVSNVATGLTSANFSPIQYAKRWIIFEIAGLSGLTNRAQYLLLSESNTSGITVNF